MQVRDSIELYLRQNTNSTETSTSTVHWITQFNAPQTNPQHWRLETVSYAAFPPPYNHPALLFHTFGGLLDAHYIPDLRSDRRSTQRQPAAFLATEWCNDEFSGSGSYCNFQTGMADAANDILYMRFEMPEHGIWLAGEHATPFDGLGTVAGADESGEAVAQRILEKYSFEAINMSF